MQIQCERLYLFETALQDPYFLGTKDGIEATMLEGNPRYIDFINIEQVYFFIGGIGKTGLTYSLSYGGEDSDISQSYGKSEQGYEVEFNMPVGDQRYLEALVGKQFSLIGMKRDLTYFAVLAQFEVDNLNIDNEIQQRVKLRARSTNARLYTVGAFNFDNIEFTIDSPIVDGEGGFDYGFDLLFD
jgi:hypothetical protein